MKFLLVIFCVFPAFAQSDAEFLSQWTQVNEKKLLAKNTIIPSAWFEKTCLKLAHKLNFERVVSCKVIHAKEINAYVFNNGHVYFTLPLLKVIKNKHQWAAVLAHENAHVVLNHYLKMLKKIKKPGFFFPKKRIKKMLKRHELEADEFAKKTLKQQGFDYSQIYYFLKRVSHSATKKPNNSHLKPLARTQKSQTVEIIDEELIFNFLRLGNDSIENVLIIKGDVNNMEAS